MANGPVRRREYEADGEAADRRFEALEERVRRLERQRAAEAKAQAALQGERRRRWTRADVIAVVAAAALLGTLALQAAGR